MDQQSVRRESIVADAGLLVGTCIVVVAATVLGLEFLRESVLGIPAGLWVIGIVFAGHKAYRLSGQWSPSRAMHEQSTAAATWSPRQPDTTALPLPSHSEATETADDEVAQGDAAKSAARLLDSVRSLRPRVGNRSQATRRKQALATDRTREQPSRQALGPIRVALDLSEADAQAIRQAPGLEDIAWIDPSPDLAPDATVTRDAQGRLVIETPCDDAHPAAWDDWSTVRPLSFATLFPVRVDPGRVTLNVGREPSTGEWELVRAAVDAAAVLSRTPARLAKDQPGRGRRARPRTGDANALLDARLQRVMLRLAHVLSRDVRLGQTGGAYAGVARACAAWLCTSDLDVDIELRREGVEAACKALGFDAESLLRAAAVRVAVGDDVGAMDALRSALRAMPDDAAAADTMTYVQAEIDFGSRQADLSLGRIIAGLGLVARASDVNRLDFLKEDLAEDLRYSPWLLGRDADQMLVLDAVAMLSAERRPAIRSEAA